MDAKFAHHIDAIWKPEPILHEQRTHMIPDEIKAIKKVRANQHIPKDVKPELP